LDISLKLVNLSTEEKIVYLTMSYEYLEGPPQPGWRNVKSVPLSVWPLCGGGTIDPPAIEGAFSIENADWKPTTEGRVLNVVGMMDPGGVEIELMELTSGKSCVAKARYAETAEFKLNKKIPNGEVFKVDRRAEAQISSMGTCEGHVLDVGSTMMTRDTRWTMTGRYNFTERQGNLRRGKPDEVSCVRSCVLPKRLTMVI
jgi:hypothetical protein